MCRKPYKVYKKPKAGDQGFHLFSSLPRIGNSKENGNQDNEIIKINNQKALVSTLFPLSCNA